MAFLWQRSVPGLKHHFCDKEVFQVSNTIFVTKKCSRSITLSSSPSSVLDKMPFMAWSSVPDSMQSLSLSSVPDNRKPFCHQIVFQIKSHFCHLVVFHILNTVIVTKKWSRYNVTFSNKLCSKSKTQYFINMSSTVEKCEWVEICFTSGNVLYVPKHKKNVMDTCTAKLIIIGQGKNPNHYKGGATSDDLDASTVKLYCKYCSKVCFYCNKHHEGKFKSLRNTIYHILNIFISTYVCSKNYFFYAIFF